MNSTELDSFCAQFAALSISPPYQGACSGWLLHQPECAHEPINGPIRDGWSFNSSNYSFKFTPPPPKHPPVYRVGKRVVRPFINASGAALRCSWNASGAALQSSWNTVKRVYPVVVDSLAHLFQWTKLYLEGTNTTAADYQQSGAEEILGALKRLEYEDVKTGTSGPKAHAERSYRLREECLSRSKGRISSCEAFTYPIDPGLCSSADNVLQMSVWHVHRLDFQDKIMQKSFSEAIELSERFQDVSPRTYALRGNTAAGKTRMAKIDPLFRRALDKKGELRGVLNPDAIKAELAIGKSTLTALQVHIEGIAVWNRLFNQLIEKTPRSSIVVDKTLSSMKSVNQILSQSKHRGATVHLLDIDQPLELSCLGVLTRDVRRADQAVVPFRVVSEGFLAIRNNRKTLLDKVMSEPEIGSYRLYAQCLGGHEVVAEKVEGGEFRVLPGKESLFATMLSATEEEVQRVAHQVLTPEYLQRTVADRPYLASIYRFQGKTIEQAMNEHSSGEKIFQMTGTTRP